MSSAGGGTGRMTAREAIAAVTETFTEHRSTPAPAPASAPAVPDDGPLGWSGYGEARARATARTGEDESVIHGLATLDGRDFVLVSFEFGFLGGSLGERTGDRLEAAYATARERRLPLVSLIATGGSRIQEGMVALIQLHRVARASALLRAAGLPQIAVLRDPATGGGWATLGAGADVVLALPGAQIGFAGSRVRPAGADPYAYTAEAQLAAGHLDAIVPAPELPGTLSRWLEALGTPGPGPVPHVPQAPVPYALSGTGLSGTGLAETGLPETGLPETGWDAVCRARSADRPHAEAYLDAYFRYRLPLRGDRCGGSDPGLLCGIGLHAEQPVAYVAQCGTATLPAGYRTAARVIRLADRLGIPVLTLIDTPGAANDAEAERTGAGAAVADTFAAIATARVPVTTLVIGEGGSGGALALAAPGNTHVTPDSYFSVIAPELAAAILKRSPDEIHHTAGQLHLRPQDLLDLGIARSIARPESRPR